MVSTPEAVDDLAGQLIVAGGPDAMIWTWRDSAGSFLRALDIEAVAAPLLVRQPLDTALPDAARFGAMVVTSMNALRVGRTREKQFHSTCSLFAVFSFQLVHDDR